jgi:glutamate synthase (NADPH/NADH) large chain
MVDLDRLEDDGEVALVHELLARHAMLTGSTVAARVLGGWLAMRSRFVAVVPRDFKRVRAAEARARAEARPPAFSDLVGA